MPAQKTQTDIAKKLGSKLSSAVKKHANDETTVKGFIRLPGGIAGIARLAEINFGVYKDGKYKGKDFCRMVGVVVAPEKAPDGTPIKGLQTSKVLPLCDTTTNAGEVTSFDDNVGNLLNELRNLGASTAGVKDGSEAIAIAEERVEAAPYFRFGTRETPAQGNFKARVWEDWFGNKGLEDYQEEEGSSVEDNTTTEEEPEETETTEEETETEEMTEESDGTPSEDDGLDELAALATKGGKAGIAAGKKIVAQAALFDISEEECTAADDWETVVGMIREKAAEGGGEETTEEEDDCPYKVDDVYKFQPLDPKTKKPMVNAKTKKPQFVEVVISAVDKEAETVELINNDDKKTKYKNVAWSKLKEI